MRLLSSLWSFSGTVQNELRALSHDLRIALTEDVHALRTQLHYLARHQHTPLPMTPSSDDMIRQMMIPS